MNSPAPAAPTRIAVLGPLVIDQIAAGEVVERPASVVKELVDNSLDAGATRIDVVLEDGGVTRISVRDNGRGIHPDDLLLAVTRHATSKLRDAADIADIATLGFRGEALASVAAVARVDLRSRQPGAGVGVHLHTIPGEAPTLTPAGMPVGTQIEVHALFANLPARRKFMRAEATEVGHCSDTLLRLAIVHPDVQFTLRHGKRELLNLPRASREGRVAQVLERRVAGPFFAFRGEDEGVRVEAFLPHPAAAARGRGSPFFITRQRVVRERSLAHILAQAYGLGGEAPSACVFVEPPPSAVDVNVHPQKAEVRFSEPQQVYAAVRRVLAAAVAAAPWAAELASGHAPEDMSSETSHPEGPSPQASSRPGDALLAGGRGMAPVGFTPARAGPPRENAPHAFAPPAHARDTARPGTSGPGPATRDTAMSGRHIAPPDAAPGPATRRVETAAANAAAERRAAADAWIARAEASVDAGRNPLAEPSDETDPSPRVGTSGASDHPTLPGSSPSPGRPAEGLASDASAWDLDLADAPAGARDPSAPGNYTSQGTDSSASSEPGAHMSNGTDGDPSATGNHMSPETSAGDPSATGNRMSHGTDCDPSAPGNRMSPGTASDQDPSAPGNHMSPGTASPRDPSVPGLAGDPRRSGDFAPGAHMSSEAAEAAAWQRRAAGDADLASERAEAWLERAEVELAAPDPLLRWSEFQPEPPPSEPVPEDRKGGGYRLSTRALDGGYDRHKRAVMDAAAALRPAGPPRRDPAEPQPDPLPLGLDEASQGPGPIEPVPQASPPVRPEIPALLACLPGPVALFADRDAILAVDLRRVRSHLVYLRLQRDLVGRRAVAVQGLLSPAVVPRPPADVALIVAARVELLDLGVDLDVFGDDAVVVRGVPAHLRHCVDDADAADLVARIIPWLRIRAGDGDRAARERGLLDAIATTHGGDPAPRLARRWLAELIDNGAPLESVPGIRRWTGPALLGGA